MKRILLICLSLFTSFALNAQSDNEIYYFDRSNSTVEFDFKKIDDYYERLHLLYNISNDDRFVMTSSDEHGLFYISNNDEIIDRHNFKETFDTFYHNCYSDFRMLDKNEISELERTWRNNVSNMDIVSLMMDIMMRSAPRGNNDSCYKAEPFCTDNGLYTFQAMTGDNHPSESGPAYSCLQSQPCPSWYYMKISTPGAFSIHMMGKDGNTERDIDYCCWGPFDDPVDPCPHNPGPHQNGLTASKVVSCSYSSSYDEHCQIPSSSTTGDYYILIITNYSRARCVITFEKEPGSGPGTTDCSIMPPVMEYSDACYGNTLHLSAHEVSNASYSWTGPNGFTSSLREPHIDNVTFANSGTYSCTVTIPGQGTSDPMTLDIEILPELHADFTVAGAAPGIPTQFTGTETTYPTGYTNKITSRTWDFGDGSTAATGTNPTHVYTTPGTYNVTYTIVAENATGGTCEDSKTIPVTVECSIMPPVIEYNDACHGSTLHLSAQYVDGVSYSWTGPNGFTSTLREPQINNVTFANSGTYSCAISISESCSSDQETLDIEILPELHADFTVTNAVPGAPTQFTGTETTIPAGNTNKITSRTWNFGDGSPEVLSANPTHVYTTPGTYNVTYTIVAENATGGTCEDSKTIPIAVSDFLTTVVSSDDNEICNGGQTTLRAIAAGGTQNYTYSWTPAGSLNNPTIATPTATPEETTTYKCVISDGTGEVEGECTVTVFPIYDATTTINTISCDPYIIDYYNAETHLWDQMVFNQSYNGPIYLTTTHGCDSLTINLNFQKLSYPNVPLINDDEDKRKEVMPGSSWMPIQYKFEIGDITGGGIEQGLPVEYNWSITYHVDWTGFDNTGTWILQENGTSEASLLVLSEGNATINCDVVTTCGTTHREIFVYSELYGVEDVKDDGRVTIYPNPASNSFYIRFDESTNNKENSVSIYNAAGILVDTFTATSQTTEYKTDDLASGLYFIRITNNDFNVIKRLMINK